MPKAIKIKGGWKVVNKYTGKTLHTYKANNAKRKAHQMVKNSYYVSRQNVRHKVPLSHRGSYQ